MALAGAVGGAFFAAPAGAQSRETPGRDLLAFPVGQAADAAALPGAFGAGLWNPADAWIEAPGRWRLAAAAMTTPSDLGVSINAGAVGYRWREYAWVLSVVRAGVSGIARTDSDPNSIGDDVPYNTTLTSLAVSRRWRGIVGGVALRHRAGELDAVRRTSTSLDAGFVADGLGWHGARVGASTFLASPWSNGGERTSVLAGADLDVVRRDSAAVIRAGASYASTTRGPTERYAFGEARLGAWELRGGPVWTASHGGTDVRGRLAIGVRYAGYRVGLSRETAPAGIGAQYQFVLSSVIK